MELIETLHLQIKSYKIFSKSISLEIANTTRWRWSKAVRSRTAMAWPKSSTLYLKQIIKRLKSNKHYLSKWMASHTKELYPWSNAKSNRFHVSTFRNVLWLILCIQMNSINLIRGYGLFKYFRMFTSFSAVCVCSFWEFFLT